MVLLLTLGILVGSVLLFIAFWRDVPLLLLVGSLLIVGTVIQGLRGSGERPPQAGH